MIPKSCKRLAEVDFPIAAVSKQAAREKSIRHGHPSTLHLWWARWPLAACRAVLMALLLPDPADPLCPESFRVEARRVLLAMHGRPGRWDTQVGTDEGLRRTLLEFIAAFSDWDNSAESAYLDSARSLVRAAYPDEPPLVVDPFAGGGSIPLEALRVGCEAFASDLNPVACLIEKVMLEDIPRHGPALADELRRVGAEIKAAAERELAGFYPPDPDGARPIAYLWARTVRCETPGCGAEIPLVRSFWLSKKANRRRALRYRVVREAGQTPRVEFEVFEPSSDADRNVPAGTVSRARATCPACGIVLSPERVRAQLSAQRGGADVLFDEQGRRIGGARLLAVVTLRQGQQGRSYRLPADADYRAVWQASRRLAEVAAQPLPSGLSPVPDEPTPAGGGAGAGRAFSVQKYGMMTFVDLFTARQKLALVTLTLLVQSLPNGTEVEQITKLLMALAISRFTDDYSSLTRWMDRETPAATFTCQALPILWDFCETSPFDSTSWSLQGSYEWVAKAVENSGGIARGQAQLASLHCRMPVLEPGSPIYLTTMRYPTPTCRTTFSSG